MSSKSRLHTSANDTDDGKPKVRPNLVNTSGLDSKGIHCLNDGAMVILIAEIDLKENLSKMQGENKMVDWIYSEKEDAPCLHPSINGRIVIDVMVMMGVDVMVMM